MDAKANNVGVGVSESYVVSRYSKPTFVEGRREFFDYIDLGVTNASNGVMRAQITKATEGMSRPTGWHFHICEGQFVYMVKGWIKLEFVDGETIHLDSGDSVYIPGGLPHNEISTSNDFELLEFSVPADMGTEACSPPNSD